MVEDKLDNQGGKWDKYAVDDSGSKWDKYSVPDDDLKKKSTPVVSSGTPSQLPSQPDFLKQGASLADNSFLKEISKSIPKGPAQPAAPEGKWSNIAQNVFANLEKAGTDLAANAITLVKDLSQNPYIPDVSSVMKEAEEITGKSIPTPWELDPLGGVIRGLHGNQERMKEVIANNPLPNTFWGKAVSSVASFAPDIAATALLPEAKLAQGASFLNKTGNLLLNNFTKYITTKEALSGYGEARKKGEDIGQASLEGIKGAGRGLKTGVELAILGAGSNIATKSVMNKLEQYGLGNMPTKELVNLGTDLLAYSIISPYANAGLEGRLATADEIANGAGVALLFRLKGAAENIKSNVKLNKALEETLAMKQGAAVSNFVDATPKSIVEVYNSKESADEFQLRALAAAKKARETTDLQKKAKYVAEASTLVRAANVKQVADMVINNRDGFAELKASDLPESAKNEFLQKAEEINKLLNPFEKAKTDLDNKIKESEDLFSQLSQQAEQSQDPNERAQLEAQAREAKDSAEKFRNELAEVKFNQNRPDANAGKEPVMEGEVAPTAKELRASASDAYARSAKAGAVIKPESLQNAGQSIVKSVSDRIAIDPQEDTGAMAVQRRLQQSFETPQTLEQLDLTRQFIRDAQGSGGRSGKYAKEALKEFDAYINNLGANDILKGDSKTAISALKDARALWTRNNKTQALEDILQSAELRATANYSQSGLETALRRKLVNLADSEDLKFFTKTEQDAIIAAAKGGKLQNFLRWAGKYAGTSPLQTGVGSGMGAGVGALLGGPVGAAIGGATVPAVGGLARAGATQLGMDQIRQLQEMMALGRMPEVIRSRFGAVPATTTRGLLTNPIPADQEEQPF